MARSLWLLFVLGALGAFDTLYFHEFKGMLPARMPQMRSELALHAARDAIYVVVFATLPFVAWHGAWAAGGVVHLSRPRTGGAAVDSPAVGRWDCGLGRADLVAVLRQPEGGWPWTRIVAAR